MYRRKLIVTAAAVFAIGVAFAAQTNSVHAGRHHGAVEQRDPWVPGASMVMSAHETDLTTLAPPR